LANKPQRVDRTRPKEPLAGNFVVGQSPKCKCRPNLHGHEHTTQNTTVWVGACCGLDFKPGQANFKTIKISCPKTHTTREEKKIEKLKRKGKMFLLII